MPMMTADQYEASLRKMKFKVYLQGELVANPVDHPVIRPSMNSVKATYALAQDPQYEDLMTATSHLTGRKINRFCHIHQSVEDLVKKVKMQRLMGRTTASCFQRCVGHGRDQRARQHHLRNGCGARHQVSRALHEVPARRAGGRLDHRRRHDRREGRPWAARRPSRPTPTCSCASSNDATTASWCGARRRTRPAASTPTGSWSCRRRA